jgi:dimeric dUTPase (all-alpha-NTP-PPase superfamily)
MNIDFTPLFLEQAKLDQEIAIKHNISYATTRKRRTLSLLVEVGELANSTRCFKYWSNKGSEAKERVFDEFADALHFLLSLGIDIDVTSKTFEMTKSELTLSELFIKMYDDVLIFLKDANENNYNICFKTLLNIANSLDMTRDDIFNSYYLKLGVNYNRQNTNY